MKTHKRLKRIKEKSSIFTWKMKIKKICSYEPIKIEIKSLTKGNFGPAETPWDLDSWKGNEKKGRGRKSGMNQLENVWFVQETERNFNPFLVIPVSREWNRNRHWF